MTRPDRSGEALGLSRAAPRGTPRVLIADELDASALELLASRGFPALVRTGLGPAELRAAVSEVEALIVRSATRVTRELLEAAPRLRVVARAGVGIDNVDLDAATERGVVVLNAPAGNTTTTAELALALLLAVLRHVPRADREVRAGRWTKKGLLGTELSGKTLGLVGLGRIGRALAKRALGLELQVLAHDPYLGSAEAAPVAGVELVSLEALLERSDFVSLHVPMTEQTRGLLSRERIALMKRGAFLVNAARGGLVDERALAEALAEGRLAGAALDVLEQEPPPPDHPLLGRDDVVLTPHLGASSREAQEAVALEAARAVADFLERGWAENALNAPAMPAAELGRLLPYLQLAEKAGAFLAQRLGAPAHKLEVSLCGEIARLGRDHVPLGVLVGLLRQGQDEGANFVNAPRRAKERGIRLLTSTDGEPGPWASLLEVRASSEDGAESRLVAGTVFGRAPRFTRVDGLHLDLEPKGTLLVTRHEDRPGVVGQLGLVLGRHGVNIRRVELGPPEDADDLGLATGFLSLGSEPGRERLEEVLRELRALEAVRTVELVRL